MVKVVQTDQYVVVFFRFVPIWVRFMPENERFKLSKHRFSGEIWWLAVKKEEFEEKNQRFTPLY